MEYIIAALTVALLAWAAVSDLRRREVPLLALAALGVLSLPGREWPWWVAAAGTFLVPRREWAAYVVPLPVLAGVLTGDGAPAVALTAGLLAWYFRWWGGADGVLLSVLALRYGFAGIWAGAGALAVGGLAALALRRRSPITVAATALSLLAGRTTSEEEVPAESELPAAAVLAVAGIALEVLRLTGVVG